LDQHDGATAEIVNPSHRVCGGSFPYLQGDGSRHGPERRRVGPESSADQFGGS